MATPLYRLKDQNSAGWKTGSIALPVQNSGVKRHGKINPPIPSTFKMYLIVFLVYLKIVPVSTGTDHYLYYTRYK
jgi:hypothetical protein